MIITIMIIVGSLIIIGWGYLVYKKIKKLWDNS